MKQVRAQVVLEMDSLGSGSGRQSESCTRSWGFGPTPVGPRVPQDTPKQESSRRSWWEHHL